MGALEKLVLMEQVPLHLYHACLLACSLHTPSAHALSSVSSHSQNVCSVCKPLQCLSPLVCVGMREWVVVAMRARSEQHSAASQPATACRHAWNATLRAALVSIMQSRAAAARFFFISGLRTNLLIPALRKECCGPTTKRVHLRLSTTPLVSPQHVLHCVSVLRCWLVFAWGSALLHFALDALRTANMPTSELAQYFN
jgi:hypothetical protein